MIDLMVLQRRPPSGIIEPCLPSKVARPPPGPLWVREIKHEGDRLMVHPDDERVSCFTRNGHDWVDRFPSIFDAALRLNAQSFLIDGEGIIIGENVTPDFHARRQKRPLDAVASTASAAVITGGFGVFAKKPRL
jgi:ATP-dependent DNA ligase